MLRNIIKRPKAGSIIVKPASGTDAAPSHRQFGRPSGVPALVAMCQDTLKEHVDSLAYVGDVPYSLLKPILAAATPEQLATLENNNPDPFDGPWPTDADVWKAACRPWFLKHTSPPPTEAEWAAMKTPPSSSNKTWKSFYFWTVDRHAASLAAAGARARSQYAAASKAKEAKRTRVTKPIPPLKPRSGSWRRPKPPPQPDPLSKIQAVVGRVQPKPSKPRAGAPRLFQTPAAVKRRRKELLKRAHTAAEAREAKRARPDPAALDSQAAAVARVKAVLAARKASASAKAEPPKSQSDSWSALPSFFPNKKALR